MRALRRIFLVAAVPLVFSAAPLAARTLTSADGRSIEANVVGFEGADKVVIRRSDTGQTFTLPISGFAETDRRALLAEAAETGKKAAVLPAGAVALELSRAKFETRREKQDLPLSDGSVRKAGITIIEEDWGYGVTLRNTTGRAIEGLRAEYVLFVKIDAAGDDGARGDGRLKRTRGELRFESLAPGGRVSVRTDAITAVKRELAGGIVWSGSGDTRTRDTLHGIWLRVYQGDTLVLESASPGTLANTETWKGDGG